ncbi:branched-chain amino acid transporter permease [Corynebacterium uterequi]|uniref:Putative branched-chain amino acid permease n=1 Tax=Corynebacterium uterequi TaxID=1072256 RepID=A0A0G3HM52_9CORY|nr:AzlD domain-containing protein [Corynebacterium uterequi]AKK12177.1 putative branched-chain amino acid permease [Corynebacterium uterequi]
MGLPEGVTLGMVAAVLLPICVVTVVLRAVPFELRGRLGASGFFAQLGRWMPVGVMTVLVVYTLAGAVDSPGGLVPGLLAAAVTVGVHLWARRAAVSILVGTLTYMVLVNAVFA